MAVTVFAGDGTVQRSQHRIAGHYVVVLEAGVDVTSVANDVKKVTGARVRHSFDRGLRGLAIEGTDADAQRLARDRRVKFVEEDAVISSASTVWALDRIDQRLLPLNDSYVYSESGNGVTVYVVDTGIHAANEDFGGRVAAGFSAFGDGSTADCNGHGTHVAGLVGGFTHGAAKGATLVPVRVLGCDGSGSVSSVLAGLDWVLQDHQQSGRPGVVNMSLSGGASSALDAEVNLLINAGLTTVVAAGNNNDDACGHSPARVSGAITVGASTSGDAAAGFSNYGPCVDLFAPGVGVLSDWYTSPTATNVLSGTSASAPLVAGVAAICLEKYPSASPAAVSATITSQATPDVLNVGPTSPNKLLFSLIGSLDDTTQPGTQLLADPGFDYGTTFWTSDICSVVNPTGCPPLDPVGDGVEAQSFAGRSGKSHASLGGKAASSYAMSEAITIPSNANSAELSFFLWVVSKGKKPTADDLLSVQIRDASGAVLETVGTFSNLDDSPNYIQRRFDIARYRGKTIRIAFMATQAPGVYTWFLLDDVGVRVLP